MNTLNAFCQAIESAGLCGPEQIFSDGNLHRFSPTGRRGDDAGWYVLHDDGVPAGAFGCWRTGQSENWCARSEYELTAVERQQLAARVHAMRRQRDTEHAKRQGDAATAAQVRWEAATRNPVTPYTMRKNVAAYGVRAEGATLLVPMRDTSSMLHSLQTIGPDGTKRFMRGGRVRGCYHAIGAPRGLIVVCEGYATGATIHQATGQAVAIAFNAGNLAPVASAIATRYTDVQIVVAADDDHCTAGNPGRAAAHQAALRVGGAVVVPDFPLPRPANATDFNDLAAVAGVDAIRAAFAEAEVA